jgi:hypothetical protein
VIQVHADKVYVFLRHATGWKFIDAILVQRLLGVAVESHFVEGFRFFLFNQSRGRLDDRLFHEAGVLEWHQSKFVGPVAPVQNVSVSLWFTPVD